MAPLTYPILISDLDGTLLNNNNQISKENLISIAKYREAGGYFTIATGRTFHETQPYIKQLDLDLPYILCNGAMLYDPTTKQHQTFTSLDPDQLRTFLQAAQPHFPSLPLLIYTTTTIYTTNMTSSLQATFRNMNIQPKPAELYDQLPSEPILKALFIAEPEEINHIKEYVQSSPFRTLNFVQSASIFYELLAPNVSKWTGISKLLKPLELEAHQCAVIGDHLNDMPMMLEAGLAATLENAHPDILQTAQVVVPSNDKHGVSHLIDRYLLVNQ